ncbi:MAG: tetratricopeptide repeat protein [Polyangiaceae bacterium]|nr:tetratricopeptide repeat protein [Polyangiaceae bacterium]
MSRLLAKLRATAIGPVGVGCLALAAVACGGDKTGGPGPRAPTGGQMDAPKVGGDAVTAPGTQQQTAVADTPSSGEAATDRPAMSGAAREAYQAGMAAFQSGDLDGAQVQFAKASAADSNAYQASYSLGVVRERLGDTAGALAAYRKATAVVPDYEPAIVAYGVLLARSGKVQDAESYLLELEGKFPKSAAITAGLAEVKSMQGLSGDAQRLAQTALKKNPNFKPAMIVIARDHYRARRLDAALFALKGILDGFGPENPPRDADNADARLLRGIIYKERGARKAAMEELQRAAELRPDLVEAKVQVAVYKLEAGNAAEAVQLLEGALKYDRTHVIARLSLGDGYRLLGRAPDALKEFEWVLSKEPSLAQVHYNLGLLYLSAETIGGLNKLQTVEKALAEFEKYKQMKPRSTGPDDTDELINRAKAKKGQIEAEEAEKNAPPPPPPEPPPAEAPPAEGGGKPPAEGGGAPPAEGGDQPPAGG